MRGACNLRRLAGLAALAFAGVSQDPATAEAGWPHKGQIVQGTMMAPVQYAPVQMAPVAYASAPVAYASAPVAAQTFAAAPVAMAPTYTATYVTYGTAAQAPVASAPRAATVAAPTASGSGYYQWQAVWVPAKGQRSSTVAGAPVAAAPVALKTLRRSVAERVRSYLTTYLKDNPKATLDDLIGEAKASYRTRAGKKPTEELTSPEESDLRAIAEDVFDTTDEDREANDDRSADRSSGPSNTNAATQVLMLAPTAAYAPVQLFVPVVHRCTPFCRH